MTELYHYTSIEVLKCLFDNYSSEKPYLTFWASNCAFMNDPLEIKEGIKIVCDSIDNFECPKLREELKKMLQKETFFEFLLYVSSKGLEGIPYAISFSSNPDNLNMWNMYGDKSKGVMLGFDYNILKQHYNSNDILNCQYYIDSDFKKEINSQLQTFFIRQKPRPDKFSVEEYNLIILARFISCIVPMFKHKTYEYENETRIVASSKTPKFRVINNLLIPYIELTIPVSALKNIMIGPNCDSRNLLSIRTLLINNGLDNLFKNVTQSTLPFKI